MMCLVLYAKGNVKSPDKKLEVDINVAVHYNSFVFLLCAKMSVVLKIFFLSALFNLHFFGGHYYCANMLRKQLKKKTNNFDLKKSELFVWMNAIFFCEDKRDGCFQYYTCLFSTVLSLHTLLSLFLSFIFSPSSLCLLCSQHPPLHAHVSTVEWVTWTDSRWCSLGKWGLISLLSPLFMQSIIILLLCLLPEDHWRDSGPPSSVPSFTFVQGNVSLLSLGLFMQGASCC